jgi:uncharacterized Zn finger protein (UPF0148 family)
MKNRDLRLRSCSAAARRVWLAVSLVALLPLLLHGSAQAQRLGDAPAVEVGSGAWLRTASIDGSDPGRGLGRSGGSAGIRMAALRPGGGHTFSGGSHSSGSSRSGSSFSFGSSSSRPMYMGRGGGSGCGVGGCFMLLVVIVIVILVLYAINKSRGGGGPPAVPPMFPGGGGDGPSVPDGPPPARDLNEIRNPDTEFSVVLFEDFAYALYAKAHESRSDRHQLDSLAPYISEAARNELANRQPVGAPVSGVVIGAMRAVDLRLPAEGADPAQARIAVVLEFESNMTVGAGTGDATHYVRERWHLVRGANVRTKPPEAVRSFHCPNCGAPFGPSGGDRCEYCGEVVSGGRFDWSVEVTQALEIESRPPALTGTTEEVGNDLPTVVHPEAAARMAELAAADPASGEEAIIGRLQLIYTELNPAWTALDLTPVRGLVSDGLFDYLQYWITAYRHQGLRNQLREMRLSRYQLAKVIRDKHFDSVTFRIWASGRDFTVLDATGQVVGGNPNADRDYSEYWTLIRGASVKGAPRTDKACPNCGAPLEVSMAGRCAHCDAKITSGDFDWVLSKIEQDETYSG